MQQLLNLYAQQEEATPVETLRYQLGAIITSSEAELKLFYSLFDDYVEEHQGAWFKQDDDGGDDDTQKTPSRWWYLLTLLPLLALLILYLQPLPAPQTEGVFLSLPISPTNPQTITVRDQADYTYPWWAMAQDLPQPDSFQWNYGDGTEPTQDTTHHYEQPGRYVVSFTIWFETGHRVTKTDTLTVRAIPRLRVDFVDEETEAGLRFTDRSYFYPGDSIYRPWDTLQSVSYQWDLGAYGSSTDTAITIQKQALDTIRAKLIVTARWRDTTVVDSAEREIYPFEPPELPSLRDYLLDADLSDLVKDEPQTQWLFWVWVALSLSYLIYELIAAWRRKVALDEAPQRGPPLRQPLELEAPPLDFFHTKGFAQVARQLRRRRSGEQRRRPDLPRSIRRSAEAGGFPEIAWEYRTQPSQYLLLIEQRSPQDHLARLFAELGNELASRDISVEVYFFDKEPRLCWRKSRRERISLTRLRNLYPEYRLLVIGEGEALLDEGGNRLAAWTEALEAWTERAWLSPKPTESWGRTEEALFQRFLVVPATQQGLVNLVQQWLAEAPMTPRDWRKQAYESDLSLRDQDSDQMTKAEAGEILTELRAYLGPASLNWLAALAWYPELSWPLTLRLGKLIESLPGTHPALNLGLDGLIRLFRLPWLRRGSLPRALREALVQQQPEEQAAATRKLLLSLLREPRNLPPEDSYAAADQQVRLALFEYLNSERSAADRKTLQQALAQLEPEDIEDRLAVQELSRINSPLSLIVPARYFRGRIPLFGLRQRWRMLFLGLPLLVGMALSGYFTQREANNVYDRTRSYQPEELVLANAADSARWLVHEGYLAGTDPQDTLATGDSLFWAALLLVNDDSLALHNLGYSRYQLGRQLYQRGQFAQAIDTLQAAATVLAVANPDRRTLRNRWYLTLMGLSELIELDLARGASDLYAALCAVRGTITGGPDQVGPLPVPERQPGDPPEPREMLDDPNFLRLLRSREAADLTGSMSDLMACLKFEKKESPNSANLRVSLSDTGGCVPLTLTLSAQADKPIEAYQWTLGDLPAQRTPQPTFTLETPGTYRPSLIVTYEDGQQDTLLDRPTITVNDMAVAAFTVEPQANKNTFLFEIEHELVGDTTSSFMWDFDDGSASYEKSVVYAYNQPGNYRVELVVYNPCSADTSYVTVEVREANDLPLPTMRRIPGGSFQMGDVLDDNEYEREKPVHPVTLAPFEMSETEVTFAQYDAFCEATGKDKPDDEGWGRDERPVINVDWYDAVAYCNWLSEQQGYRPVYTIDGNEVSADWSANGYRLPTEAEWEYAAREGGRKVRFGNGQDTARAEEINFDASADYKEPYSEVGPYREQTVPVRSFSPNALGLYEMSGNVYEWCWDWYGDYSGRSQTNPRGPNSGVLRVLRGGSWLSYPVFCRVSYRARNPLHRPSRRFGYIGFRLTRTP